MSEYKATVSNAMNRRARSLQNWRAFLGFGLSLLCASASADNSEVVEKIAGAPGHTVWRITRPRIDQAATDYNQILFAPGNTVTVMATGCANPGGNGSTSTQYVDPAGGATGGLHHGKISLPGATNGLEFFKPFQPTVYTIPTSANLPGGHAHLTLGYNDDGYKDNGYKHHDNGASDQCWQVGDAVVTIDIGPSPNPGAAPETASYLFKIEDVTIRHLRSQHNDTDLLTAGVVVDGTQSDVAQETFGKWQKGAHATDFSVLIDSIAPNDRIAVAYAIVNAGHPTAQATATLVTNIIGQILSLVPTYGSVLQKVSNEIGSLINLINPDCDGPVVAGSIPTDGAELFAWTHAGATYRRTLSFPGVDSADGCGGNSFYEVTYSVVPTNAIVPYSLIFNVPKKTSGVSRNALLLRHH